jgi:SAM-dependent methyltransferase
MSETPQLDDARSDDFDERIRIGPETQWFWDPLACHHISRYLLAQSWTIGQRVIDVACGTGYGSAILARDTSRQVVGIDLSRIAVETAQADWPRSNLVFAMGDALDLGLPSGSVDTVVSFETIEHVHDPKRFLDQMALVLRPGGRLILSTPDRNYYSPGAQPGESHNPFHPSEMTSAELLALVEPRFRILAMYGQTRVAQTASPPAGRRTNAFKRMVKRATNPILGKGPLAEKLLPAVRRHLAPQPLDGGSYTYIVVVCENPLGSDSTTSPAFESR